MMTLYTIPGWGFSSSIFNSLNSNHLAITGLDYIDAAIINLEYITKHLADSIPDHSVILGWSFGGLIAIKLASLYPNKVKKLILISSQPKLLSDEDWLGIEANNADRFSNEFNENTENQIEHFIKLVNFPNRNIDTKKILKDYFLQHNKEKLLKWLHLLFNADLRQDYQSLTMNILHIINKEDAVIKQNDIQLKSLNSNTKTITINKSGHAGFLTHFSHYQNIIKDFICDAPLN